MNLEINIDITDQMDNEIELFCQKNDMKKEDFFKKSISLGLLCPLHYMKTRPTQPPKQPKY